MLSAPAVEALFERDHAPGGAFVGIGDDAFLDGAVPDPGRDTGIVQARHGMDDERPGQLGVTGFTEPRGTGLAVAQRPQGVIGRQGLVDIMEERGSLDQASIDSDAGARRAIGQERGHLGHDGHVLQQAW